MKTVTRITVKHGKTKRTFVLTGGPKPEVGDLCTLEGQDWEVLKVKDEKCLAAFDSSQGKPRQVFP